MLVKLQVPESAETGKALAHSGFVARTKGCAATPSELSLI